MPVEMPDISLISDSESIFAPVQRAQAYKQQQNALRRQTAVRNALASNIDPATGKINYQNAYAMGGLDVAPELQQMQQADMMSQAELFQKRAQGQKASTDAETAYWSQQRDTAARIGDQSSWSTWRSTLPAEFQQFVPEQYSDDNKRRTLVTADKALELRFEQINTGSGGYTLQMPVTGGPATPVPGSNYTKAPTIGETETERHNRTMENIQRLQEARLRSGSAPSAVTPKPKDATVSEQQAAYHGKRILDAAAQIAAAAKKAPSANRPSALEATVSATPGVRNIVGAVRSAPRQIVTAAQREMLDALLYLATGAAYNKEQLEGEIESTLPAYLDKPETVKAKRDRLRLKIDAAKIRAGDAWTPEMDAALAVLDADAAGSSTAPAASSAPAGVDAAVWNVMTPEERALWQK
jgi:hypothetical protein